MDLRALLFLYGWRLRTHPLQEAIAGIGIAIGVGLLFAVQIANASLTGSIQRISDAVAGHAQVQLASRDDRGMDGGLVATVRGIPGVRAAAPVLERRVTIGGPRGRQSALLIGADQNLSRLGGAFADAIDPGALENRDAGLLLPEGIARATGALAAGTTRVSGAGRAESAKVAAILGGYQVGALSQSNVVIGSLAFAQKLLGLPRRISRVLVWVDPGRRAYVMRRLRQLADGRLAVDPVSSVIRRSEVATAPNSQATGVLSVMSVMLLAFNAMLLTMPVRRRFVAELQTQGFTPAQVIATLVFQAIVLGVVASAVGLAIGAALARGTLGAVPTYIGFTFPSGTQRVVPLRALAVAFAGGVLASALAVSRSFADLRRSRALDAVYQEGADLGEWIEGGLRRRMLMASAALVLFATTFAVVFPFATMIAVAAVAAAVLVAMPSMFTVLAGAMDALARRLKRNMLLVALIGAQATLTRSIAVVGIVAVAIFGSVTLGGARHDLIHGLAAGYADHLETADIWITSEGRSLTTESLQIGRATLDRLRHSPAIASARIYQGTMYDLDDRRIWVIARPREDRVIIPPSQILNGDPKLASTHLRGTGWVSLSVALAHKYRVRVGDQVSLPTPTGVRTFHIAAITTNLSWSSGALIMNTSDYQRAWASSAASAVEVNLRRGVSQEVGRAAVVRLLGRGAAYDVQTAKQLEAEFRSVLVDGLTPLSRVCMLMLVGASIALSGTLGASIWQRRFRLAAYKTQGFNARQLRRIVLLEVLALLSLGSAIGAAVGLLGHALCDRWLELTTGFPAPFSLQPIGALRSVLPVIVAVTALTTVPRYLAARVPAGLRLRDW